jgi:predicted transcriptional regulator of viral defense system
MIDAFKENKGYMSFKELQKKGVTVLQIREMEEAGVLEKFARGWYWCNDCGFAKPADHKYVEIAKVNPKAVICMESACFLSGIIDEEPQEIRLATERTDRKKMELDFDTKRFYFKRTGIKGEIVEKKTKCGSYYYYSPERTFCDCIRLQNKIDKDVFDEIMTEYKDRQGKLKRTYDYADKLRCIKNIQEADATVQS